MGYSTERKGSISGEEKASENGGQELLEYSIVHGGGGIKFPRGDIFCLLKAKGRHPSVYSRGVNGIHIRVRKTVVL